MEKDYLQKALHLFNINTPNWYSWKKFDDNGNKIPNKQRMCYECVVVIKEGAVLPSKAEVDAKIEELKQIDAQKEADALAGNNKLLELGLTQAQVTAMTGYTPPVSE